MQPQRLLYHIYANNPLSGPASPECLSVCVNVYLRVQQEYGPVINGRLYIASSTPQRVSTSSKCKHEP